MYNTIYYSYLLQSYFNSLGFLLAGKGISSEELFDVINSSNSIDKSMEILNNSFTEQNQINQDAFSDRNDQENCYKIPENREDIMISNTKENGNTKHINEMKNGNQKPIQASANAIISTNINQTSSHQIIQKYKFIKNRKDLKYYLKKKRKDLNIDSTTLKETVVKKETNGCNDSYVNYNGKIGNNNTATNNDNNTLSLKENNANINHNNFDKREY